MMKLEHVCPACGDAADYCTGHGSIGDPHGARVLAQHDEGNHVDCHPESICREGPEPEPVDQRKPGLRLDAVSGLHGRLVEYVADSRPEWGGWAIVERDQAPFPDLPYSVHRVYVRPEDGAVCAESGEYELSLLAARRRLDQRAGRRSA